MSFTTSLNTTLTDWLAGLAAGRRAGLERNARRFASLTSLAAEMETTPGATQEIDSPRAILSITSGLHRGALLELTAPEYLIGSGDDCDIVLRDGHVAARHCRLARRWSGFEVRDLRTSEPQVITPKAVAYDAGAIEAQYEVGGVVFALRQPLSAQTAERHGKARTRFAPEIALAALAGSIALTLWTFAASDRHEKWDASHSVAARIVAGNSGLSAAGFSSIHFASGANGELEIIGVLDDSAQRQRLDGWLRRANYGAVTVAVQLISGVLEQARRALAAEGLRVEARNGRLQVEGVTTNADVRARIRALSDDLRGTLVVEDHVEYHESRTAAGPFPLRLRGVMIGAPSYFLTESGARYFVGGVLPDGAEVLAIEATQIRFRLDGRIITYKLE